MQVFLFCEHACVAQHLAFSTWHASPWKPSLQEHVFGAVHSPLPLHPSSLSHEAALQVLPPHPSSHEHLFGAVQLPCWHPWSHWGISHFPGGSNPTAHSEQLSPAKPFLQVQVPGAEHTPFWQP